MRRLAALLAVPMLALPAVVTAARAAGPAVPQVPQDACQPDPTIATEQVLHCRYGPMTVTPGDNMILVGPVTIESPHGDGYVTGIQPNLRDAVDNTVPPIHVIHLHHAVWLSPYRHAITPFMATGEEKTVVDMPDGYGYRVHPTDVWVLNYMLHNLTPETKEVFITYDLTWVNASAQTLNEVTPVWMDVIGGVYPVYDPAKTDLPDVSGHPVNIKSGTFTVAGGSYFENGSDLLGDNYDLVWMAGHVHPGGIRDDVSVERCNGADVPNAPRIFRSDAVQRTNDPRGFGSWDFRMTVTQPGWRYRVKGGARFRVDTVYDTAHPYYEAMGIVFAWAHKLTAAEASVGACGLQGSTTGAVSVLDPPDEDAFFGGDGPAIFTTAANPSGAPVDTIHIADFAYLPDGSASAPAPVRAGQAVRFVSDDAAASIYHTVTSCPPAPGACDRAYGQSYPLPSWDFDSDQIGYNPFEGQNGFAWTQSLDWSYAVPAGTPVGTVLTYFCRIHPFMRGALEVVG